MEPMNVETLPKSRYGVTIYDDKSCISVVLFMRNRSEVDTMVKDMITMLETQSGKKLKRLRGDSDG